MVSDSPSHAGLSRNPIKEIEMRRFIIAACTLTVLAACQPATTELTEQRKAEIAAEVELLHDQYWDAWREVDKDRGMSYYRNSPEFIWADEGELIKGWSAANDMVQAWTGASQAITFNERITTVLAPNVVQRVEQGTYVVTDTAGSVWPRTAFASTTMWVFADDEWKVDFIHISRQTVENP
jgi:hypothetical protein